MDKSKEPRIALLGAGTIGLSFTAFHLANNPNTQVTIYDIRPDAESYIRQGLTSLLPAELSTYNLNIAPTIPEAVTKVLWSRVWGQAGLEGFFKNIGGTVQAFWDDSGTPNVGEGWEGEVFRQAKEAYGTVDVAERDRITRKVLQAVKEGEEEKTGR